MADVVQSGPVTPDLGFHLHRLSFVADARLKEPLDADSLSFKVDRRSFLIVVLRPQKILGTAFLVTQAGRTGCPSARRRPCRGWRFGL